MALRRVRGLMWVLLVERSFESRDTTVAKGKEPRVLCDSHRTDYSLRSGIDLFCGYHGLDCGWRCANLEFFSCLFSEDDRKASDRDTLQARMVSTLRRSTISRI
jgi:hypothetical protein